MPIAGQKGISQQLSLGPLPIAELLADDQKKARLGDRSLPRVYGRFSMPS